MENFLDLNSFLQTMILKSKTEEILDCVFMETPDGWKVSEKVSLIVGPFSRALLPISTRVTSNLDQTAEVLVSTINTIKDVVDILLSEDQANDQTGFNIINANDLCNFFISSTLYIDCLIELKARNLDFDLVHAQKTYLSMISACLNTINLIVELRTWAEKNNEPRYVDLYFDFLENLENLNEIAPILLDFRKSSIYPEKAQVLDGLIIANDFDRLQEEMILLLDFERELKNTQHEQRCFCVHYIHKIFHALVKDTAPTAV